MVSVIPRVDLLENTEMNSFCILSLFGLDTLCKHNESVDIGEKLVSVRFEWLNKAHKRYKSCIFPSACLWFTDHTHSIAIMC